jgi:hypothetical protein
LMTMAVCRCNTERISQCIMTRASLKATGRHYWATTLSVLPRRPHGRQSTQRWCNMYPLCWPLRWPLRCDSTIPCALLYGGGSWLSEKPLNAAIGRALTLILPIWHANTDCFGHFIVKKSSCWYVGP